ncbi:asparaginase [Streptacidiphilus sp. PB12-B1b]|uniref:asparaginase n=1 Tax=Streptacidiphilus sp. PB12-B1b TaxID=2705012 RepID=UPI0015FC420B|nr:asparaginase [Streptacidiphilus sp. PB12-B1b]QMU79621.1 asparaginase [Streptacidiphilus sp. PB12-B1b]
MTTPPVPASAAHAPAPASAAPGAPTSAVLAEVVRSGFVEGLHRGSLVVLAPDGSVEFALGAPGAPVFPRSSNKPMQAAAVLRTGLDLDGELLALAAASHSAESFHLDAVQTILTSAGLGTDALQTPPSWPLDEVEREDWIRSGGHPEPILMDCSGKHAAMLAACVANGWDTATYLDPAHPVQQQVLATLQQLTGEQVHTQGTDGCGAPLLAVSLIGLARAFQAMLLAEEGSPERRVADAMRAHPEYVAGTRRIDTWLMRGLPGAMAKMGAEAVQAVALPDGRALAFKIDDGAYRAVGPVLAAVLRRLGVPAAGDTLNRIGCAPLYGGGRPVGEIRPAF